MRVDVRYYDGRNSLGDREGPDFGRRFLAAYGEFREALGRLWGGDLIGPLTPVDELQRHLRSSLMAALSPLLSAGEIHDFQVMLAETPDGSIAISVDVWPLESSPAYGRATAWVRGNPPEQWAS